MSEWDEVKKGIDFLGRLSPGVAMREMGEVGAKLARSVSDYAQHGKAIYQAVEGAKGELAQMASAGASKSDDLLVIGLPGLRFFDEYLPLYNDWKGAGLDLERDIYGKYRRLYGIDFGAFHRDIGTLQGACGAMQDTYAEVDTEFRGLVATWSGEAAVAATNHISKFLEAGHSFQEGVNTFGRNVEHHVTAMESVVRLCAQSALELFSVDCGGQIPPSIEQYIKMARRQSGVTLNDTVGAVLDGFGEAIKGSVGKVPIAGDILDIGMGFLEEAANKAKKLLDNEFVPAFESKLNKFNDVVCGKTEQDLRSLWDEFIAASECVPGSPFADVPPLFSA